MCPEHIQLLSNDVCFILELSMTFLQLFFSEISEDHFAPSYLNCKSVCWFLTWYFQKVSGRTEKAASRHGCRRIMKRRKDKKYCCEVYSSNEIQSGFPSVLWGLISVNLLYLSYLVNGTVLLLSRLRLCVTSFVWKHCPRVFTLSVHFQKGF